MAVPVQASLTTSLTGSNNDVKFTSRWDATKGNATSVCLLDPEGITHQAAVIVDKANLQINVFLRRASNIIAMTANELVAAIKASPDASELVDVALAAGNDGTGVLTALSRTTLSGGVDPSFANQAEAETVFRTLSWTTNNYLSEKMLGSASQQIVSLGSEANHRQVLNKWYLDLARRGRILEAV